MHRKNREHLALERQIGSRLGDIVIIGLIFMGNPRDNQLEHEINWNMKLKLRFGISKVFGRSGSALHPNTIEKH